MYKYENFIGKVLDSRYKILELVGLGGMAFVLKAEDLVMNRIVAIKILNDEYNGNEQAEARFINESKAVAMLSNKNIVSIYDVAIYPDMKYIVMEFLDGITLREYLDNKNVLPWKEACVYILQILRALEHAHSKGVIHRDIKPQNIMLQKNGEIKVTDFGIAKLPNTPALTLTEKAIGTVYYISPEQASGKETEYYSDIYAVGIMLYEAVTGKLPFMADSPLSIAMMQVSQEPQNPRELVSSLPLGVSQIILKAMQKDPHSRFASAHSMSKAIEWVLRNPDVVFLLGSNTDEEEHKSNPAAVSIDMIDTSEIQNYVDNEIAETLNNSGNKQIKKKKEKPEKVEKKNRTLFPVITGVALSFLLVTIVIGAIFAYRIINNWFNPKENPEATYPNLVGEVWNSELKSKLINGVYGPNFKVKTINYAEKDDFTSGQIIATEPVAETTKKKSSNDSDKFFYFDSITVCRKLEDVILSDLTFYTAPEAGIILRKYDINTQIINESNNDFYDGQIIRTEPEKGSIVRAGDTVTLVVCKREESAVTAPMPDLAGLTRKQAEEIIKYSLYTYVFEPADSEGIVLSQSIAPNTVSPKSTQVIITLKPDGLTMPSLLDMSKSEAISMLTNLGLKVADYKSIFFEKGDRSPKDISLGLNYTDAVNAIAAKGYVDAPDDSENSIIVYQSIPADTPITEGTEIYLIYGVPINEFE
ncbi:MAG: hypothetical protein A2Y15_01970 [Clostridiales bacterium GWF2_36_10]|nr:MAG: hypothetical protein A2Y15_01970 [Clostridiales bacterium GWF2_36_10]HAN20802.1 hypothetical protein [Clostridiales bacterium]